MNALSFQIKKAKYQNNGRKQIYIKGKVKFKFHTGRRFDNLPERKRKNLYMQKIKYYNGMECLPMRNQRTMELKTLKSFFNLEPCFC